MWPLKPRGSDSKYREINNNDGEDTALPVPEDHRHWNLLLYIVISILATGWTTTAVLYWKSYTAPKISGKFPLGTFTPIPEDVFKPVRRVFQPDERYIGNSKEVDHHWDDLVAGHDAVWIEDPDKWGLPEGIVAPFDHPHETDPPQHDFYVISILHQLHCLNMVRFQFWQARDGVDLDTEHDAVKWNLHVLHCFEYLRQAISCGGDLIIEGSSPIKVGKGHATSVTGWGVEHDCIDFELLRQFQIEQERKFNLTWQHDFLG
ncbi:hypothetical protein DTO013E5_5704 [Penicillium roqueforti]|uniref:Uncharacterized protein n=1 Tax=Penicillium roqueforti (strain FM164) TaxID=1365484 RepID=W6QUA0_PENRF|nr:uncharacterized protein LCP9604111_7954 [Penicillium roqueforti]XP_057046114.1 uncharacterized protein N7518_003737 [Penicillium psychrosexuale]CDM33107.1 Protein of unknown function DUF3328 [Penicillium roqueforti FM164]KAF9242771.1 hypothetical protein LCP9604111_7954 [Penicillium roqueforti]KAI1830523.1 hypothetical protein CBS147337_8589 [Penicillium roqueforti]KAI2674393.1 hypothetical protein CBS147355_7007 [Penicillium roqueforti]KAI2683950.1 hypothetical protein LCP963914a_5780 [Pe